jgi:ribonuclease Z
MLRVMFIGTSSARPTVSRNTSALAIQREGDLYLFDCGEGTQRQMMRYGVGFTVSEIFLTHMHADHYLGTVGLLRTMSLQDREEPLGIFTPPGGDEMLRQAVGVELDDLTFPVRIEPLEPGGSVRRSDYAIQAYPASHAGAANGYVLREDERPGRFFPERALGLGVPEGPLFGRLQRGEAIELEDGRHPAVRRDGRCRRRLRYAGARSHVLGGGSGAGRAYRPFHGVAGRRNRSTGGRAATGAHAPQRALLRATVRPRARSQACLQ